MQRPWRRRFGEFEIVLRLDLLERRLAAAAGPAPPCRRSVRTPRRRAAAGRISSSVVASSRPASMRVDVVLAVDALAPAAVQAAARRWRRLRRRPARRDRRRRNVASSPAPWRRCAARQVFPASARRLPRGGLLSRRRLGFVVGNDAPDRRQNLLHRGFLDLRRLRHLQLHIINALACVLHQATTGFAGSGYAGRDFHRTSLTCPQIKRRPIHRAGSAPCSGQSKRRGQRRQMRRESLCCLRKGYVMAKLIASNAPRVRSAAVRRSSACERSQTVRDQRPSGVRTPNQLSRT